MHGGFCTAVYQPEVNRASKFQSYHLFFTRPFDISVFYLLQDECRYK